MSFHKGEKLTADALNKLERAANRSFKAGKGMRVKNLAGGGVNISAVGDDGWYATIVCSGSCDDTCDCPDDKCCGLNCSCICFSDNRYWVVRSYISNQGGSCDDLVEFTKYDSSDVRYIKVPATNLAEQTCGTHILAPGTVVWVRPQLDLSSSSDGGPQWRYVFDHFEDKTACHFPDCSCSDSSDSSHSSESSSSHSSSSHSQSSHSLSSHSSSHSDSSHSLSSHSQSGSGSGSGSTPSQSTPSTPSESTPSQPSQPSTPPMPSESGSNKSTAIVPASWSPTGYTALFISEAPEVRFDDVIVTVVPQQNCSVPIDPKYLEVCEAGSVQVCGCVCEAPIAIGAKVSGGNVNLRFNRKTKANLQVVIRLTGIRKGFAGMRFSDRTKEQFVKNEQFINSAY